MTPVLDMLPDSKQRYEEAFRHVLAHRTMLKAYVKTIVLDPILAEDTFSDVTLEIVRSWENFDQSRPFPPWARGVARRVALANVRKHRRQATLLDGAVLEAIAAEMDAMGTESVLDRRKEALRACMENLSEKNQTLLRQRYFENRSYGEIAMLLSRNVGALYMLFSRLHQALLRCIHIQVRST